MLERFGPRVVGRGAMLARLWQALAARSGWIFGAGALVAWFTLLWAMFGDVL